MDGTEDQIWILELLTSSKFGYTRNPAVFMQGGYMTELPTNMSQHTWPVAFDNFVHCHFNRDQKLMDANNQPRKMLCLSKFREPDGTKHRLCACGTLTL